MCTSEAASERWTKRTRLDVSFASRSPSRQGAGGLELEALGGHGEEVEVALLLLLLGDPRFELGGDEAAAVELLGGGLDGAEVGVLVLRMAGVALHPAPLQLVSRGEGEERLPQLQVLHRACFALPAAGGPAVHPLRHRVHQVAA